MKHAGNIILLCLILIVTGCIDPFSPPEVNSDQGFLVVDGFLNVGMDTSKIVLRRSQNLNADMLPQMVSGATVWVESKAGERYVFEEKGNGAYYLAPVQFDMNGQYRLNIGTGDGSLYQSEYVAAKNTPVIDSVSNSYDANRNAMVFSVNTHDAQNSARFYKWNFEDTYEYTSNYYSSLEMVDSQLVQRRQQIYTCYRSSVSTNIMLGSSIKLSEDRISQLPINIVDVATNKLWIKYSMLVKQQALTQDAFEYWTALAKTTQGTGSLFDPLPSLVTGNIRNVNNGSENVFGYFSAATETKKRIFVTPGLGHNLMQCDMDTLTKNCSNNQECVYNTSQLIITEVNIGLYQVSSPYCVDCRLQGGTTTKPSFW